jgi:peptidoglycan/LPS O-acetylase OafA/YrhL
MPRPAENIKATIGLGQRIPALDGLRGIAVLAILFRHFNIMGGAGVRLDHVVGELANASWMGVDLFFVLSGFLITGILCDAKGHDYYFRNFYVRRCLRIFPLYYAFLLLLLVATPHILRGYSQQMNTSLANQGWLWTYATNILIAIRQDWSTAVPGANHLWSLAVEEQFYALWPAVVLLSTRRRLIVTCLVLIAAAPLIRTALWIAGDNYLASYVLTFARADTFAVGAFIAVAVRTPEAFAHTLRWARTVTIATAILVISGVVLRGRWSEEDVLVFTLGFSVVAFMCGGLLVEALRPQGPVHRLCDSPTLRSLGLYSYGLYVFHPSIRRFLLDKAFVHAQIPKLFGSQLLRELAVLAAGITVSFGAAWLSWHLFEKQILKLKVLFPYGSEQKSDAVEVGAREQCINALASDSTQ